MKIINAWHYQEYILMPCICLTIIISLEVLSLYKHHIRHLFYWQHKEKKHSFVLSLYLSLSTLYSLFSLNFYSHFNQNEWIEFQGLHIQVPHCISHLVLQFWSLHCKKRQALEAKQGCLCFFVQEERQKL